MASKRYEDAVLLANLRVALPVLRTLLEAVDDEWGYEDPVYRFYHGSFKVYRLQETTKRIVATLRELLPDRPLNKMFMQIVESGTGKTFDYSHNQRWMIETRPIVEAFFHARFFLEMAVRYGELTEAPGLLPSGWAAFLYFYDLR